MTTIVGLSGSLTHPSRTTTLVERILETASRIPGVKVELINIADLAADLGLSLNPKALPGRVAAAYAKLFAADGIVIASPVYKASYTGLLKHFLDLVDPRLLNGKSVLLAATGGNDQHHLVIEHQLRPLAAFFGLYATPTGIYLKDAQFAKSEDGKTYHLADLEVEAQINLAVDQLFRLLRSETASLAEAA